MAISCALEGPDMGLAAPHCHPAPPEAQGNSWGCLGPAVAMLVAIQRPKRAKSVPRQKGPKLCKSTLGGSRGMKPPQPMAQITQRGPWGVREMHRTRRVLRSRVRRGRRPVFARPVLGNAWLWAERVVGVLPLGGVPLLPPIGRSQQATEAESL